MAILENQNVICLSSIDWDPIWTRKQQIMSRLPKSNTILYVEPPITLLSAFKDPEMWQKWSLWFKGIRKLNENTYLYSPPVILPFGNKYRFINKINQRWMAFFIKRNIAKLGLTNPYMWTYMPNSADIVDLLGQKQVLVYDCVDEHTEYTGLINKAVVTKMERDLMSKCDVVFVTAQGLYDSKKDYAETIYFLPNAANVQHFMKAQDSETVVPEEMLKFKKPIVGFVGVIRDWIDLDLVLQSAKAYPQYSFVMVGPVGAGIDISELLKMPNISFLGRKDVKDLPNYMKAFDVCINPFKLNELTDKVSPLKFYEYLASGKPIVSVDMPGVSNFADVVEIAKSPEEFVNLIKKAVEEESKDKLKARLTRALDNSWDSRVNFMVDKIMDKLSKKK